MFAARYTKPRDAKADYQWQKENFPVLDRLYQEKDFEGLTQFYIQAIEEDKPVDVWEHGGIFPRLVSCQSAKEYLEMEQNGETLLEYQQVQLDSKIQHSKYEKQLEQYLADEDYLGFSAFCNRHYIRAYDDGYEEYRLLVQTSLDYSYAYQSLMRAVASEYPDQLTNEITQLTDTYERIERVLHPTEEYGEKQLQELDEEKQQAMVRMEENLKILYRTYFGMTEEEAENFGQMSKAQKTVFLEEKGEVMGYGKSVE